MEEFTDKVIIERSKLQDMEAELAMYRSKGYEVEKKNLINRIKKLQDIISDYKYKEENIKYTEQVLKDQRRKITELENELEYRENKESSNRADAVKDAKRIKELETMVDNLLYENKLLRKYRFHFWKRLKK